MSWIEVYDATFFITITTILTGSLALAFKYCLKSKCENLDICWGLLKIDRRVDLEVDERIELGQISPTMRRQQTI